MPLVTRRAPFQVYPRTRAYLFNESPWRVEYEVYDGSSPLQRGKIFAGEHDPPCYVDVKGVSAFRVKWRFRGGTWVFDERSFTARDHIVFSHIKNKSGQ
jgi:hypothetical protein